jgi:hypothetical protein
MLLTGLRCHTYGDTASNAYTTFEMAPMNALSSSGGEEAAQI